MLKRTLSMMAVLALSACTATLQTTSGKRYLEGFTPTTNTAALGADEEFIAAASVEPLLTFPARFGIARIERGQLTPIPDGEMAAWANLAEDAGAPYGEFVPINLLVAELATPQTASPSGSHIQRLVRTIRLGAARQHLDAVLVYEVYGTADNRQNPLSVGDLTILGAYLLPGRNVEAVGHAEALMFDVRNGYPYLTASETVDRQSLSTGARARGKGDVLRAAAMDQAVKDLAAGVAGELENLKRGLERQSLGAVVTSTD